MALSGVHVACGYIGGGGNFQLPLLGTSVWSETMAAAGTTQNTAPAPGITDVLSTAPAFIVSPSLDVYIARGKTPDASQVVATTTSTARHFVRAGTTSIFFCHGGEKLAWVAA